jgi:hypothetical protein
VALARDWRSFKRGLNRDTVSRIVQREFNAAMERAKIKYDPFINTDYTVYSLRHTAICMRIILSKGQVNIFNLAKTARISVDRTVLCAQSAAIEGDGQEPAEFWGYVSGI